MGPIVVFDSGYGGLTVLKEFVKHSPQYDYIYLGDNARAPYGNRSFETVYQYTLECLKYLFDAGCPIVILACNTSSAKALRTIQQIDLPKLYPHKKVLGVIRPTTEVIGSFSKTKHVGIFATSGTVNSNSYPVEINKFYPDIKVFQEACPMWVPLIENNEHSNSGSDYFISKNINSLFAKSNQIDTVLLGCTHYALIEEKIKPLLPSNIKILTQGSIVAKSLIDYLLRHSEMESQIQKSSKCSFLTTDDSSDFDLKATLFYGKQLHSQHVDL